LIGVWCGLVRLVDHSARRDGGACDTARAPLMPDPGGAHAGKDGGRKELFPDPNGSPPKWRFSGNRADLRRLFSYFIWSQRRMLPLKRTESVRSTKDILAQNEIRVQVRPWGGSRSAPL
jgi:hypothetical protein